MPLPTISVSHTDLTISEKLIKNKVYYFMMNISGVITDFGTFDAVFCEKRII